VLKEALNIDDIGDQDYLDLYDSDTVEKMIKVMNRIQLKVVNDSNDKSAHHHSKSMSITNQSSLEELNKMPPFTDCIVSHIDEQTGELTGFTVRPILA
jgi:hypothetical protein